MRTIKAAVLYDYNTPMVIEEVQLDDPGPNEVLVKMAASGVCRSDLHVLKGEWKPPLPTVLGSRGGGAHRGGRPRRDARQGGRSDLPLLQAELRLLRAVHVRPSAALHGLPQPGGHAARRAHAALEEWATDQSLRFHLVVRRIRGDPREQRRRHRPGHAARTGRARRLLGDDGRGRGAQYCAGAARQHGRRDRLRRRGAECNPGGAVRRCVADHRA